MHEIFEKAPLLPREELNYGKETIGPLIPTPFIVGAACSGTTLLRLTLDSYPDMAIPPETHFIPQICQEWQGNSNQREFLLQARFIHIIRDGRDVAISVRDKWFGPNSIAEAANRWVWVIAEARCQAQNLDHYLEIHYEDLILNPTDTLKHICEFISLPWDSAMLNYYERADERLKELKRNVVAPKSGRVVTAEERLAMHVMTTHPPDPNRVDRWRNGMTVSERKSFEAIGATMLRELGYEVD